MHQSQIFNIANMSFNFFHKNKILVKISVFTVTLFQPVTTNAGYSLICLYSLVTKITNTLYSDQTAPEQSDQST